MEKDHKLTPVELRRLAEARLAELGEGQDGELPEESRALIHELRTHQIELEMQNDELRQTEAELTEVRNCYTDLYDFSPSGYVTLSHELMIEQANLTFASMLDVDVGRLLSAPFSLFVCKEDQDIYYQHHRAVMASGLQQVAELRLKRANGNEFWARIETRPEYKTDDASGKLLLSISDISLQKSSEHAVEHERDRAETYLHMAGTMLIAIDRNRFVTLANNKACEILGYAEQDIIGKNWFDHFLPEAIRGEVKAVFDQLMAGEIEPVEFYENRVLTKGGRERLVLWHNSIIRDDDGLITGTLTSGEDITERRAAEQKAFELIQAIEQTGDAIILTDAQGKIEYVNRAFTHTTGYSFDEAIGNNPRMLHSGRQNTLFYEEMWSDLRHNGEWKGKIWNRRKNGEIYPEQLHINGIRDMEGNLTHYSGVFSDISGQLSLEQQLQQAQKMEAIGTLVGGIAHDFNNMLAAITGSLFLAKEQTKEMPSVSNRLGRIETQCFRAADMIKQLLTFARKDNVHMIPFDLTLFIKESFKLSKVSISENIHLNNDICSEKLVILGDATQMQQLMLNLVNNARDAVVYADKPCINISLARYEADENFLQRNPEVNGRHFAHLCVSDNGYGISKSNIEHLFEPYFTTKEVGKGTGLGLAMVYGSVQTHLGAVEVESNVNEGSSFHIYLPLNDEEAPVQSEPEEFADAGNGEIILLADDEASVRNAVAEVLQSLGYKVLTACNGQDAVDVFKEHAATIDLLILDVVMPDMGGLEAARCIRAINPDVPIIFSTGYDAGLVMAADNYLENAIELSKPVPIRELNRSIHSMLYS